MLNTNTRKLLLVIGALLAGLGGGPAQALFSATDPSPSNSFVAGSLTAPTGLTVSLTSPSEVLLSWTAPSEPVTNWTVTEGSTSVCSGTGTSVTSCDLPVGSGDYPWSLNYYDHNWETSSQTQLDILTQAVAFTSTAPSLGVIGSTYTVAASGTASGNTVALSIDSTSSGACTLSGATLTFAAQGVCVIDANQAAGNGYQAAPEEQQSIDVNYAPTCAAQHSAFPSDTDGTYTLDLEGVATSIYCYHMSTNPTEYLTLAETGPGENYSQLPADYGSPGLTTTYTKVRLLPSSLQIDTTDTTFSTSTGYYNNPNGSNNWSPADYGTTHSCQYPDDGGSTNVDLESTSFAFYYGKQAWFNATNATLDAEDSTNQNYSISGVVGNCENFAPAYITQSSPSATANQTGVTIGSSNTQWIGPVALLGTQVSQRLQLAFAGNQGQAISLSPIANANVAAGAFSVSASKVALVDGYSTNAISYTGSGNCTVSSAGLVTPTGPGSCTVIASQAAATGYLAAVPVAQTFQFVGAQAITFSSASPTSPLPSTTYTPTATGGASVNPVTFSIASGSSSVCSISSGVVTFLLAGTCVVDASQAASNDYQAAPTATQSITVG